MERPSPRPEDQREYARVDARLPARYRIVEPCGATDVRSAILERPTVWTPDGEDALRELASSGQGHEARLASALLDACAQIASLRARVEHGGGPMQPGLVRQISGGGGKLETAPLLDVGALLDLHFEPSGDTPPLRVLAEVVHVSGSAPGRYGFRFAAIHAHDRERLIRFVYLLQRRALRRAQEESSSEM